jgi:nucleoside-diphosphate-sugar epimerase
MRSLVTGATGFIGSHVAEILKDRGHSVRLLVRDEKRLFPELQQGYEVVRGDVTQSPAELQKAVEGCDYVFHVAGLLKGRTQHDFNRVNATGTKNLCQAIVAGKVDVMRMVLVSSLAAIGERYAREFETNFPLTIIRPPAVYGPRDTGILEFFKFMAKGYSLQFGEKEKVFSMIHGRDLARGIVESAMHDATVGQAFFLADPEPYPMGWTMALLRETLKPSKNKVLSPPIWLAKMFARTNDIIQFITRRPMLPNSDKMRELLPPYWVCSADKARQVFNFESKIPIREGLAETADWYIKNGWIKVR